MAYADIKHIKFYPRAGRLIGWLVYDEVHEFDGFPLQDIHLADDDLAQMSVSWHRCGPLRISRAPWHKWLAYWILVRPFQWIKYDLLGLWKDEGGEG